MVSAATIRMQVESALARKIPSALTPQAKMVRPVAATGIEALDDVLRGGLPIGAVSELVGRNVPGERRWPFRFSLKSRKPAKFVPGSMFPTPSIPCRQRPSVSIWHDFFGCAAACKLAESSQRARTSLCRRNIWLLPPSRKACTEAALGHIHGRKLMGFRRQYPVCCIRKPSRHAARNRRGRFGPSNRRSNPFAIQRSVLCRSRGLPSPGRESSSLAVGRPTFTGRRLQRHRARHGQPRPEFVFASAAGNMVPLSAPARANAGQHPASDTACMREKQRRTVASSFIPERALR